MEYIVVITFRELSILKIETLQPDILNYIQDWLSKNCMKYDIKANKEEKKIYYVFEDSNECEYFKAAFT